MVRTLVSLLVFLLCAFPQEVGEVREFRGPVDLLRSGALKGVPLEETDRTLSVGDMLRTKRRGYAKVFFVDSSVVEIFELTRLRVLSYERDREVSVQRGVVRFEVRSGAGVRGMRVITPHVLIGVKGTVFWVFVFPGFTLVKVEKGNVSVEYRDVALPMGVEDLRVESVHEPFSDRPPAPAVEVKSHLEVIVR